jgi:AcrR family transcriptional regulator
VAALPDRRTTRRTTRPESSGAGRHRILDLAATLFVEQGYEGTSLRHLAGEVGMKPASLYYHFASKDDLLTEVLQRGIEVMHDAFDVAEQRTATSPASDRIEAHVRAHLSALYEHGPYTAAHVVTFPTAPASVRDVVVPARDAYEARWTEMLSSFQQAGALDPDASIRVARLSLMGVMNSSVEWFDPGRSSIDEFATAIARQFWNGVAA